MRLARSRSSNWESSRCTDGAAVVANGRAAGCGVKWLVSELWTTGLAAGWERALLLAVAA